MRISSHESLLADELRDIYSAENQMIKALPVMVKASASEDPTQYSGKPSKTNENPYGAD